MLKIQEEEISSKSRTIDAQVREVMQQREILSEQEQSIRTKEEAIQKQKIIILAVALALLLVFGLVYFIWRNYQNKKRANILLQAQRDQIAYQKKHITDSIEYAKMIQTAILPSM